MWIHNQGGLGLIVERGLHGRACRGDGSLDTFGVCEQPSPADLGVTTEWGRFSAGTQCRRNRHHPQPVPAGRRSGMGVTNAEGAKGCFSGLIYNHGGRGLIVERGLHGRACRGDGSLDTCGVCEQPSPADTGEQQTGDGFLQACSAEGTVTTLSLCLQAGVPAWASRTLREQRDASAG